MTEDPAIIQLNIRHYQALLKLNCMRHAHDQIRRLLAEAQAQLPRALVEAEDQTPYGYSRRL